MTKAAMFTFVLLITMGAMSQTRQVPPPQTAPAQAAPAQTQQMAPAMDVHLSNLLTQLERAALDANGALGRLRVDKWKANSSEKEQAQANVQSLQRNLSYAIPELTSKIRQAPQDLSANFKLYRNLNALYDVLANVAESAGAFGPKDQYEMLAQPVSSIDDVRHQLGDRLDQLTAANQTEIDRLRSQIQAVRQAEIAAPPKKIVVDDNTPAPKAKKPKAKKPTAPPSQ